MGIQGDRVSAKIVPIMRLQQQKKNRSQKRAVADIKKFQPLQCFIIVIRVLPV